MSTVLDHFMPKKGLSDNEMSIRHQRIMYAATASGLIIFAAAIVGLVLTGFHNYFEPTIFIYMGILGGGLFAGGTAVGDRGFSFHLKANKAEKCTYDFSDIIKDLRILTSPACWSGRCSHITSQVSEMQNLAQ